jgi:hypothetical protein
LEGLEDRFLPSTTSVTGELYASTVDLYSVSVVAGQKISADLAALPAAAVQPVASYFQANVNAYADADPNVTPGEQRLVTNSSQDSTLGAMSTPENFIASAFEGDEAGNWVSTTTDLTAGVGFGADFGTPGPAEYASLGEVNYTADLKVQLGYYGDPRGAYPMVGSGDASVMFTYQFETDPSYDWDVTATASTSQQGYPSGQQDTVFATLNNAPLSLGVAQPFTSQLR